jgi:hypothetical protein
LARLRNDDGAHRLENAAFGGVDLRIDRKQINPKGRQNAAKWGRQRSMGIPLTSTAKGRQTPQ